MSTPSEDAIPIGDPFGRDVDLAWELYDARPDHPQIREIVGRILAGQPERTAMRMLLGLHLRASGERDEARQVFEAIVGARDEDHYLDAARKLRDLARAEENLVEARRWARFVFEEDATHPPDWVNYGGIMAMDGDFDAGWSLMDDGVTLAARTAPDFVPGLLLLRTIFLLQSFAPPERFIPAAEEAIRADATSEYVTGPLAWAYVHAGRIDDARALAERQLRLDPTDELAAGLLGTLDAWEAAVAGGDVTMADLHEAGVIASAWTQLRAQLLGVDLTAALAALDEVLPAELAAALRPPLDPEEAVGTAGEPTVLGWHDGQEPGTGTLWGSDAPFRLMSSAEVAAMDAAVEADPDGHPQFVQAQALDYYVQIATDDQGGYLLETLGPVVIRRAGAEDQEVAPSLADWFWDRVAAFGGRDPRPVSSSTTS